MKRRGDLVIGWVRKAESDLAALELALNAETALDTACFHAQQAAEKFLKAYLVSKGVDFPFTHNLARLLDLCEPLDPAFAQLRPIVEPLTPFAVELRYDDEFWPSKEIVTEAQSATLKLRDAVLSRLPAVDQGD